MWTAARRPSLGLLSGRLARQLFALFLLASLVPLAISAWVSTSAITTVAEDLNLQQRRDVTRQVSKMVLDRLLAAGAVLDALPLSTDDLRAERPALGPRHGAIFCRTARFGAGAASGEVAALDALWQAAGPPAPHRGKANPARLELRTAFGADGQPHVLMASLRDGAVVWLAEVDPDHLWQPLDNASEDSSWQVRNRDGRLLRTRHGGDATPEAPHADHSHAQLFLLDLFGADDWSFEQQSPTATALWHGHSLTAWLTLVAVSTLLAAAALVHWQIRRRLAPLQSLTTGTQSLAAGHVGTRVAIERQDEIGELATSFNRMAGNLEAQFDAMRAVADIDRGVITGASMHSLAKVVGDRLRAVYPHGHLLRWTGEDGVAASDTAGSWADPKIEGMVHTEFPIEIESVEFGMLGVTVPSADAERALAPARELRDRLTVAFAARARERQLRYHASHDSLTGLLNRHGFNLRLHALLVDAAPDRSLSLLLLDLDHFKEINDSMGHAAGDELLCLVAHRLRGALPRDVPIGRQGGDEFAVVLAGLDRAAVWQLASRVLDALSQRFPLRGLECELGASIGIAHRSPMCSTGDELLRQADLAMYAVKAEGRGRCKEFSSDLDVSAQTRQQLVAELREALQRDEFVLHYQPRIDAASGRTVSAEALVRWQHPTKGLVYPDVFIPVCESTGLVIKMGEAVLAMACAQLAAWRASGLAIDRVSVNVSPLQLAAGDLPQTVRDLLAAHALPAASLELEVTESTLVGDVTSAHRQLAELRALGITIALDDFGTGYSSLSSLRQLPIDVLKIDRSFVRDLHTDAGAMAVTQAIVALAKSLGKSLVAEGVETQEQAALLRGLGCDELQGYFYARPMTAQALPAHLARLNEGLAAVP